MPIDYLDETYLHNLPKNSTKGLFANIWKDSYLLQYMLGGKIYCTWVPPNI